MHLAGRYYYDSAPDFVVLARHKGQLVGTRIVIRRTVLHCGRSLRLAGLGIAVDPDYQRRGVGRRLTDFTLRLLADLEDEIAMAFLSNRAGEALLAMFGFRHLRAQVSYVDRITNALVVETMPCFVREFRPCDAIEGIEREGSLHVGVGIW